MNIVIINYNSGNLASLVNSILKTAQKYEIDCKVDISNKSKKILNADRVILPGVGDFYNCKKQLQKIKNIDEILDEYIKKKERPFLGICIGMQLMAKVSYERSKNEGLGFFDSEVKLIKKTSKKIKVPHMGWNDVYMEKDRKVLFSSLNNNNFYFVHSYHMQCKNKEEILAHVNYGEKLVAAVCKNNIIGVQFHPEKSQIIGQKFLKEFLVWNP